MHQTCMSWNICTYIVLAMDHKLNENKKSSIICEWPSVRWIFSFSFNQQVARFALSGDSSLYVLLPLSNSVLDLQQVEDRMTDTAVHQMINTMKQSPPQLIEVTLPQIKLDVQSDMHILIKKLGVFPWHVLLHKWTNTRICFLVSLFLTTYFPIPPHLFSYFFRTVVAVWGCQSVWPLLRRQAGSGWCQTQSLPRADWTGGWGRGCQLFLVLSLPLLLLCPAAFHHAAVEWPGQCATICRQSDWPMMRETERRWRKEKQKRRKKGKTESKCERRKGKGRICWRKAVL